MKLESLRTLQKELYATLKTEGIEPHIYYLFADKWHDLASEQECQATVASLLGAAKHEDVAFHAPSSADAWYYFESGSYVVRLTFRTSPQLTKRRRFRDVIKKAQDAATNAYKVSHNPLTHLLARDEFRLRLTKLVAESGPAADATDESQEGAAHRTIAVLAFDIDHFKQVNDTWGHLYGDQVLKAFGRRLEIAAASIRAHAPDNTVIELGHPSGEEFLAAISAPATRDQFIEWANELRKSISDAVLPADEEWRWLSSIDNLAKLTPPPLHERVVTASVGLTFLGSPVSPAAVGESVSGLLDRADTALYRAKAAGRNQVIAYDEILASHGRVLEFESSNGVAALDIGANVGVAIGQEFNVFSPMFSGKTKLSVSDGRSRRTLGVYPRVRAARLVVFDSQPEISFAYVATEQDAIASIESGSHLEAIPTGSIGHLLPSSSKYFVAAGRDASGSTIADIKEYLTAAAKNQLEPFAIVLRFTREADYLRKFGSVALNASLAQLYREARVAFHVAKHIELVDRGAVCVVGQKGGFREDAVAGFVERLAVEMPELGLFAGVFTEIDRAGSEKEGQEPLRSENALEFARFAASDAGRHGDARVRHFSYMVAGSILQALRESRALDVAEADCQKLLGLGLASAPIFNQAGLIASALGKVQAAMGYYSEAIAKAPAGIVYKSNFGTAAYRLGETDAALKILNELTLKELDWLKENHAYGYVTYARLLARAKLAGSPGFDQKRFDYIALTALDIKAHHGAANDDIVEALKA